MYVKYNIDRHLRSIKVMWLYFLYNILRHVEHNIYYMDIKEISKVVTSLNITWTSKSSYDIYHNMRHQRNFVSNMYIKDIKNIKGISRNI